MNNYIAITEEDFRTIFVEKITEFYDEESQLLEDDLCERALVFRIGCHLHNAFDGCSVYCEYNKAHGGIEVTPKQIRHEEKSRLVYPDVIIFSDVEEGSDANKIVVEVKKITNRCDWSLDIDKLRYFTQDPYGYDTGYHLILGKSYFILCLYEHGNLVSAEKYDKVSNQWIPSHAGDIEYANAKDLIGAFR